MSGFERLLEERRDAVLDAWLLRIAKAYPSAAGDYLDKKGDRFANPVAGTLAEGTGALYDALRAGADDEAVKAALDPTVRLRAVQSFAPSEAVGFVLELKAVLRDVLAREILSGSHAGELTRLEDRIDRAALAAFDIFMGCREQLMKLRSTEMRLATRRLLARAGLTAPEEER